MTGLLYLIGFFIDCISNYSLNYNILQLFRYFVYLRPFTLALSINRFNFLLGCIIQEAHRDMFLVSRLNKNEEIFLNYDLRLFEIYS